MAYVHEGHSMMSKVTAMGCTATGIVGAFLAVNSDPLDASFHAMKAELPEKGQLPSLEAMVA